MNKSSLKTGMVLELRNGNKFLLLKDMPTVRNNQIMIQGTDIAVYLSGNEQINLINYSGKLYYLGEQREMDVVKVFIPKRPDELFTNNIELVRLWKRE